MQIRVLNLAHVERKALSLVETLVEHIFHKAGIQAVWVDCDATGRPCGLTPGSGELWLQLLPKRPPILEPETAGYALLVPGCRMACGYAAISLPAVESIAHEWKMDASYLMGAAIAHEIGHLLLGADSHTPEGIMRAHFGRREIGQAGQGTLLFSAEEARKLRGALEAPR